MGETEEEGVQAGVTASRGEKDRHKPRSRAHTQRSLLARRESSTLYFQRGQGQAAAREAVPGALVCLQGRQGERSRQSQGTPAHRHPVLPETHQHPSSSHHPQLWKPPHPGCHQLPTHLSGSKETGQESPQPCWGRQEPSPMQQHPSFLSLPHGRGTASASRSEQGAVPLLCSGGSRFMPLCGGAAGPCHLPLRPPPGAAGSAGGGWGARGVPTCSVVPRSLHL